ncbi:hypothetical protein HGRIS_008188 [Hohenbuehelia grisea]|uniref:Uncharacterized protein n=1 Tax=Hohenbuehelia grisea TaxID=104357 RepID=A0ABR3J7Q9_9AGAR
MPLIYFHGSNNRSTPSFAQAVTHAGYCPAPPSKHRTKSARHNPYPRPFHMRDDPLMMSIDERFDTPINFTVALPVVQEEPIGLNLQAAMEVNRDAGAEPRRIRRFQFLVIDLALAVVNKLKGNKAQDGRTDAV